MAFLFFRETKKKLNFEYNEWEKRVSTSRVVMADRVQASISILVNGEKRTVREGETLAGLVAALELQPERLAIEMDRRIVKRIDWPAAVLTAGAAVEIVQFVGGG